jgi:hypothetical protein
MHARVSFVHLGSDMPYEVTYLHHQMRGAGTGRQIERRMRFDALGRNASGFAPWQLQPPA